MISEWECPYSITPEYFKKAYPDPLKRAADQYLSAAVFWKESEVITLEEFREIPNLWQRVDRYLKKVQ